MSQVFEVLVTDITGRSAIGRAEVLDLDMNSRLKRSAKKGAAFFFAGLIFLPVPFIHLFLPPAFFVAAAIAFFSTLKQTRTVPMIDSKCPACGVEVQFPNHKFEGLQKDVCSSCRQHLRIEIRPSVSSVNS